MALLQREAPLTTGRCSPWKKGAARVLAPTGGSDPRGCGAVESRKSGVAPAQHGVLPVAKVSAFRPATSCCLDTCAKTVVTSRVTYKVTWAFCVTVTGPR